MAEKKKRGLLSWLGFGDEEQSQTKETEQQVEQIESEETVEQPVEDVETEKVK